MSGDRHADTTSTRHLRSRHGSMSPTWSVSVPTCCGNMLACLWFLGGEIPDMMPTLPTKSNVNLALQRWANCSSINIYVTTQQTLWVIVACVLLGKLASKHAPSNHGGRLPSRRLGSLDACWRCRHRRRERSRRRGFLLDAISRIDRSWWPPSFYGRHEASLPARKHTPISQHATSEAFKRIGLNWSFPTLQFTSKGLLGKLASYCVNWM